ncbi:MAG: hypothetical protein U0805_06310 [Pirellulales bacterium]
MDGSIREVALAWSSRLSDEHLFDLMDAIHNVPEFLAGTNDWFTPDRMRSYLASYDERWSDTDGLHLVRKLDEALLGTE